MNNKRKGIEIGIQLFSEKEDAEVLALDSTVHGRDS